MQVESAAPSSASYVVFPIDPTLANRRRARRSCRRRQGQRTSDMFAPEDWYATSKERALDELVQLIDGAHPRYRNQCSRPIHRWTVAVALVGRLFPCERCLC